MTRLSLSTICLTSTLVLGIVATLSSPACANDSSRLALIVDPASTSLNASASEDLYLEVALNGNPTGKIGHFVRDGARFLASAETLRQIGFRLSAETQSLIDLTAEVRKYSVITW